MNGRILSFVKRNRLHVIGDGESSVRKLIKTSLVYNLGKPRPAGETVLDNDAAQYLRNEKLTLNTVPAKGERFYFKTLCNSGPIENVMDEAPEEVKRLVLRATEVVGAKLCAIDLISDDFTNDSKSARVAINEVNTSPALFNYGERLAPGVPDLSCTEEILRELFGLNSQNRPSMDAQIEPSNSAEVHPA